jgi:hypothetical protein
VYACGRESERERDKERLCVLKRERYREKHKRWEKDYGRKNEEKREGDLVKEKVYISVCRIRWRCKKREKRERERERKKRVREKRLKQRGREETRRERRERE